MIDSHKVFTFIWDKVLNLRKNDPLLFLNISPEPKERHFKKFTKIELEFGSIVFEWYTQSACILKLENYTFSSSNVWYFLDNNYIFCRYYPIDKTPLRFHLEKYDKYLSEIFNLEYFNEEDVFKFKGIDFTSMDFKL